ncbi:MAG: mechanosensitive ion channel domain-containing protein [Syntrophorhabdus sp.]
MILALFLGTVRAEVPGPSWDEMIKRERLAVDWTKRDINTYIAEQSERIRSINEKTHYFNQQFMRLSITYNMFEGNPVEMRDVLRQMTLIRDQGISLVAPIKEESEYIDNLKRLLQTHLNEYNRLAADPTIPDIGRLASEHVTRIGQIITMLDTAKGILDVIPNGIEQLIVRLEPRKASVEHDLEKAWKKYFFVSPSAGYFSPDAWKATRSVFANSKSFFMYWFIPYAEDIHGIAISLLMAFAACIALLGCFMFLILRLKRKYPEHGIAGNFLPSAICFAFGFPLFVTGIMTGIGPLSALTFIAETMLAAGFVSLGFQLCRILSPDPAIYRQNPLWVFWVVFSLGILLQLFHVAVILYSPLMILVFIATAMYSFLVHGKIRNIFDKRISLVNAWLSVVLCIFTCVGWGALAILTATIWFVLSLSAELVIAFGISLRKIRLMRPFDARPASRLVQGVAFPMLFLGVFVVTILWTFLYIGGMPLAREVIGWRINIGYISMNPPMIVIVLAFLFITRSVIVLINAAITFLSTRIGGSEMLREGIVKSLHAISSYAIWSLFILVSLKLLGVNVTHLAIVAGGLSIGAGFGLQDLIKNSFSGLVLLFGRSIHPGDEIQLDNIRGTVIRINIRNTIVQTNDDSTIFIPNSDLVNKNVVNWTYRDPRGRAEIPVSVAYESNTDRVREILIGCATSHPGVLTDPPPYVLFWDFGEHALAFRLRFWIRRPVQTRDRISSAIRFEIKKTFKQEGIEMAFPQQDVHIRTADGLKPYFKPD